ncbi:SAM-dependent methyltransferase [Desulfonema limicola]|uniref:SAM-dependent methyltransferase n=1 Tax=Desulfonema limicola TaxID=45656 RepID=A0A975B760_9BACT|nr:methyltransferase domain-containing protein [Desulfonema limicola]QTA80134.1 SAM-dependent methyltransferase [Desulfonema limicola]
MKTTKFNLKLFILVILSTAALTIAGIYIAEIDTDITKYLPHNDPVISDAGYIFKNHPMQDQLIINISHEQKNQNSGPDILVQCAEELEKELLKSGLFKKAGMEDFQALIPELIDYIINNLPVLFSEKEINQNILPLLDKDKIQERVKHLYQSLTGLDGIGQASYIEKDPLGLKDMVLARLADMAPSQQISIYKGRILSSDLNHALIIAVPAKPGTDTAFAKNLNDLLNALSMKLGSKYKTILTPVGAYRAALDNETIVRKDVQTAILFATLGIAVLLLLAFPRPLIGLLAFLPALAGTAAAFFVFALTHKTISIMALGFGGAIISITIDHGIAYLLFLDQPHETKGKQASKEIWALGLIAALTTMGAFGALYFSDFPMFEQLGQFTALGIGFSFLFVHFIFPKIFPAMPPAQKKDLPLRKIIIKLSSAGKKGAFAALVFASVMLFFAKPEFNVNLSSMNTVTDQTSKAEKLVSDVWGSDIFSRIYIMTQEKNLADLQDKWDSLLKAWEKDMEADFINSGFIPSMIFPGRQRAMENFAAWEKFWSFERIERLKQDMADADYGFSPDAFAPFYNIISRQADLGKLAVSEKFFPLAGISRKSGETDFIHFSSLTPGKNHNPKDFYNKYKEYGKIFDPVHFSKKLGNLLFSTFMKMLFIISAGIILLLFIFFFDLKLTTVSILPVIFAMISTLGTLKLAGHPLDIPALMLSIIVLGMGIDYSLFMVRAYQRYPDESAPEFEIIKTAVFMASISTIIGFGVLIFAEHSMLKSAGLTSLLAIGYSLAGAFLILPPILNKIFEQKQETENKSQDIHTRVCLRYKNMEAYPRMFARFKLKLDPMFAELSEVLKNSKPFKTIIDIGCGYGVPACWLLEKYPGSNVYGIDPDDERIRIADRAINKRGYAVCAKAPDLPDLPEKADAVFLLDIIHFLNNKELSLTLERIRQKMNVRGTLIIRSLIPRADKKYSKTWKLEEFKMKTAKITPHYRTAEQIEQMIIQAGFKIELIESSGTSQELMWFKMQGQAQGPASTDGYYAISV